MRLEIIPYTPEGDKAFFELNIEWLETFFYVEDFDREVLTHPRVHIIDPGGHIFFAKRDDAFVGTVALMPHSPGIFELTKMAVYPKYRGQGIGQALLQHCVEFARTNSFQKLLLYSNTKLENAIYMYRKFGFVEVDLEQDTPYLRSNIKMELKL